MLGPSGCGKTTTLRMIAGFEAPTSGAIRLEDQDVSRVPPYKRNVNTVFQHYALFPHMSVWDNVAFGPKSKKVGGDEIKRRVGELLEVVRLTDFAHRKPNQLSGGQQQRVALARALVNYPSALLLDEPLAALDLKLRQAMQLELKRIQREVGITFVFVTHDQEEALTMSDRIAVMNEGRVEQIGAPRDIYDAPASVFVAGFIGDANLYQVSVVACADDVATVDVAGSRLAVPSVGDAARAGDAATLMVRPERVRVFMDQPQNGNVGLACTVTDLVFQGPVVRVRAGDWRRPRDDRARRRRRAAADAPAGRHRVGGLGARSCSPVARRVASQTPPISMYQLGRSHEVPSPEPVGCQCAQPPAVPRTCGCGHRRGPARAVDPRGLWRRR